MAAVRWNVRVTVLSALFVAFFAATHQATARDWFSKGNRGSQWGGRRQGSNNNLNETKMWLDFGGNLLGDLIEAGKQDHHDDNHWHHNWHHNNHHDNNYYYDNSRPVRQAPKEEKVSVKPNKVVKPPVTPKSNASFSLKATPATFAQLNAWKQQTQQENAELIDELAENLPTDNELAGEITALAGPYTVDEKNKILEAVKNGDSAGLQFILNDADKSAASGLLQHTQAFGALAEFEAEVNAGTASSTDVSKLLTSLAPYYPQADRPEAQEVVGDLMANSDLMGILNSASPGTGILPTGGNSQIVWVPGLDPGTVLVLGNGVVMVGYDGPSGDIQITEGSALGAAGIPVAIGTPVPETEAEEVTSGVVLLNGGTSEVNYVVNNTQFSMKPGYTQTLPEGTKWTIRFDRGKGGTASYTLTEGTYKFTPVDEGWELYEHTSKVTIDNSGNPFEFSYVVDNKREVLAAGESQKHTSKYPLIVRFDNGKGSERRKKVSGERLHVAVTDNRTLDLYEEEAIAEAVEGPLQGMRSTLISSQDWTRRAGRRTGRSSGARFRTNTSRQTVNLFGN